MHNVGRIVRLQIQRSSLKTGKKPNRAYDPAPLLTVDRLALGPDGALGALKEVARLEGIIPALESSHAVAWLLENKLEGDGFDVLCLSGRGDKDLAEYTRRVEGAEISEVQ